MTVRPCDPGDAARVRALLTAAFPTAAEAELVERLRADGDVVIELVDEVGGALAGHVLFSKMEAPFRALALGPVAVAPERQRGGIGSALIRAGHDLAAADGWEAVFVLGDPAYYKRFGYSLEAAQDFDSVYAGPHFMVLGLTDDLPRSGRVDHAAAFAGLD